MNKLTAEVARRNIHLLKEIQSAPNVGLSMRSELFLQALEIALPILEQQERGEGWIEWRGGNCPVPKGTLVDVRLRDGSIEHSAYAWGQKDDVSREFKASYAGWAFWLNERDESDIIAYRIIPERATNQNGEQ